MYVAQFPTADGRYRISLYDHNGILVARLTRRKPVVLHTVTDFVNAVNAIKREGGVSLLDLEN